MTTEDFRVIKILEFSFILMFWKIIFFWYNHEISYWILAPFLSEAVEASRCYLFENQEWISKIYYLRIPKLLSNKILLTYFNLSEPIHKIQFNVRYPVCKTIRKFKIFILFEMWVLFCATFWKDQSTKFWIKELKSYLPESCSVKQEGLLSFGWVQLQTHQKVLTGNGQLTKVHL